MTNEKDGWQEWSKFVLKELERLNKNYGKLSEKIDAMVMDKASACPYRHTIKELIKTDKEQDKITRQMDLKFARWTGYAVASLTILNILFHLLKTKFGG